MYIVLILVAIALGSAAAIAEVTHRKTVATVLVGLCGLAALAVSITAPSPGARAGFAVLAVVYGVRCANLVRAARLRRGR